MNILNATVMDIAEYRSVTARRRLRSPYSMHANSPSLQISEMTVSISKYRYRCRYFFGSVSVSVSTILLKPVSISNIGDTFEKYR